MLSGDAIVIWGLMGEAITLGARSDDYGSDSGSVCLFVFHGATWAEQMKLHPTAFDRFGRSVAVSTDSVVDGVQGVHRYFYLQTKK